MGRFNSYFNNDFRGCRLLANARDNCRERDVRIYAVPGEVDCVGVSDGTDRWIAPALDTIFSVPVRRMMRDIADGKSVPVFEQGGRKPRVSLAAPRARVLVAEGERRRVRV